MDWLKEILNENLGVEETVSKAKAFLEENFIAKKSYDELLAEKDSLSTCVEGLKSSAILQAIKAFKPKDEEIIKKLLDGEAISFNEEGNISGINEQLEKLKEEKPFLFNSKVLEGKTPFVPNTLESVITKEEFEKMGYKERTEIYNNNPDLYNQLIN